MAVLAKGASGVGDCGSDPSLASFNETCPDASVSRTDEFHGHPIMREGRTADERRQAWWTLDCHMSLRALCISGRRARLAQPLYLHIGEEWNKRVRAHRDDRRHVEIYQCGALMLR
jgi:hypothetical protein